MGTFSTPEKSNLTYLDTAANGNGNEKALLTLEALHRLGETPIREVVDIVEIGPGGGAAVNALADALEANSGINPTIHMSFLECDGVESRSLKDASDRIRPFGTTQMCAGLAQDLDTHFPSGADIITASAVMHEIYSYGGGYPAVDQTISAIAKTIRPGGYFAYRDVFGVTTPTQHQEVHHMYATENWRRFAKLFLPYYLERATHPYHHEDDSVLATQHEKAVGISDIDTSHELMLTAPIGVLRELQRHYITLRDHLWRTGVLGVVPELSGPGASDWLDKANGHKRVHYELGQGYKDPILVRLSERDHNDKFVIDGDIFDVKSDLALGRFLQDVENGDEGTAQVWGEWLKREGSETYVYASLEKFVARVALRSLSATDGTRVLMPVNPEDTLVIPRAYYNRFLNRNLSNPLFDGKQLALFEAIDLTARPDRTARALDTINETCSKETLAKIYEPIMRAARI